MSLLNKPTWKQKWDDFINRIAPFDGNPLIQKTEHSELVGDDLSDSIIFRIQSVAAINSPAAAFDVDFNSADQFDIDSSGSASAAFTVTLIGLNTNETGILKITKKAGDTFTFANGDFAAVPDNRGQDGKTEIKILVKKITPNASINDYSIIPLYDYHDVILNGVAVGGQLNGNWPNLNINTDTITEAELANNSVGTDQIQNDSITNAMLKALIVDASKIAVGALTYSKTTGDIAGHFGLAADCDDATNGGVYQLKASTLNNPPSFSSSGNLTVTVNGSDIIQTSVYGSTDAFDLCKQAFRTSADAGASWSLWFAS